MRTCLIACLLSMILATSASAISVCSCDEPRSPAENRNEAYAVFTGTVTAIHRDFKTGRQRVEFSVEASWKGAKHATITVISSGTDALALVREGITCGYEFSEGARYLVYAYRKSHTKGLAWVSRCGGTKPLANAAEDIRTLGEPILVPASK